MVRTKKSLFVIAVLAIALASNIQAFASPDQVDVTGQDTDGGSGPVDAPADTGQSAGEVQADAGQVPGDTQADAGQGSSEGRTDAGQTSSEGRTDAGQTSNEVQADAGQGLEGAPTGVGQVSADAPIDTGQGTVEVPADVGQNSSEGQADTGQGSGGAPADAGQDLGWDAPLVPIGTVETEGGAPPPLPLSGADDTGMVDDAGGADVGDVSPIAEDAPQGGPAIEDGTADDGIADDGVPGDPVLDDAMMADVLGRLDICIDILLFGDVLLALLLGCLCASIFSRSLLIRR